LLKCRRPPSFHPKDCIAKYHRPSSYMHEGHHYLILYNPASGSGSSGVLLDTMISPILLELKITYDAIATTGPDFARKFVAQSIVGTVDMYNGIIVISGDGMMNQIVNGVADACAGNPEKMKEFFEKCPLILIPGGSSNGTCASFGGLTVESTIGLALKCENPRAIRLLKCSLLKLDDNGNEVHDRDIWSLLHISWGSVAEHDYWQEMKMRGVHPIIKNVLAPIFGIGQRLIFRARIIVAPGSYNPLKKEEKTLWDGFMPNVEGFDSDTETSIISAVNVTHAASDIMFAPLARPEGEEDFDVILLRKKTTWPISRYRLVRLFLEMETGSHILHPLFDNFKTGKMSVRASHPKTLQCGHGYLSVDGELTEVRSNTGFDVLPYPGVLSIVI